MNRIQRWTLVGALLLIFLAGLFPPYTFVITADPKNRYFPRGRTFLFYPKRLKSRWGYVRIDYYRLGLEWLTIAALGGAVFLIARRRGV